MGDRGRTANEKGSVSVLFDGRDPRRHGVLHGGRNEGTTRPRPMIELFTGEIHVVEGAVQGPHHLVGHVGLGHRIGVGGVGGVGGGQARGRRPRHRRFVRGVVEEVDALLLALSRSDRRRRCLIRSIRLFFLAISPTAAGYPVSSVRSQLL